MPGRKTASWRSPSNIALVKYWGKTGLQLPANASVSFTLSECYTETAVLLEPGTEANSIGLKVFLNGLPREDFKAKIEQLLARLGNEADFLKGYHLEVKTMNSFPHSSGIASSASGMSALVLCLLSLEEQLSGRSDPEFFLKASRWSRLASGSASRSVYGGVVLWGRTEAWDIGRQEWALPLSVDVDPVFHNFCDYVLLVERGEKAVSSSAGHGLMKDHPYATARFAEAERNLLRLRQALSHGDLNTFGETVESEALQLHAMMMSSRPYYLLMKPNTLAVIERIWEYRRLKQVPLYFTLDAGANIHLLFPAEQESRLREWVDIELSPFLQDGQYIADRVGQGPERLF